MKWVAVLLILLGSGPTWAADAAVMVLRSADLGAEEGRLVEALRIYTRDLPCRVVVAGRTPSNLDRPALEVIAQQARAEGATIALWVARRPDGRRMYDLLSVDDLDVRETEIGPSGPERAAQAVALKVRTLLARRADAPPERGGRDAIIRPTAEPAPDRARAPAGDGTAATFARAPAAGATSNAATATTGRTPTTSMTNAATRSAAFPTPGRDTAPTAVAVARTTPPADDWLELGAAYAAAGPIDAGWVRHGLTIVARLRLGRRPLFLFADGTIAAAVDLTARGFDTTLHDVPLGLGIEREWVMTHITVAAGPRVGLHMFDATTRSADGQSGGARQVSAGAGIGGRLAVPLGGRLSLFLTAGFEALLPPRTFNVARQPAVTTGPVLVLAGGGLSLAIP